MNPVLEKYRRRSQAVNSLLCVGLDLESSRIPAVFANTPQPQYEFGKWIIDQTAKYCAAVKPNMAFYEARGAEGLRELEQTMQYLHAEHPDLVTICDAKRGDIGNTNEAYATAVFDTLGFDVITLHPYLGREALSPFLRRRDKACIILCRTSNPGAGELQDLNVDGEPLWQVLTRKISTQWNEAGNCMLVVGATYPEEMRTMRRLAPELTFLVPGVGAQGGDVRAVVDAGLDVERGGLIISSSRSILFSPDPADAARALRDEINRARGGLDAAD